MTFPEWGAIAFGLVIGWITYRTLRRSEGAVGISDIASVIGAVGGAAVLAIFQAPDLFAGYAIGLAVGFFLYLIVSFIVGGKKEVNMFMGESK